MTDSESSSLPSSLLFTQSQGTLSAVASVEAAPASQHDSNSSSSHINHNKGGNKFVPGIELPANSRIVQTSYLERYTNKKDLTRRLRNLVQVLRHDDSIEADNVTEWPGLAAVSQYVVSNFIHHKDKEIRLYAVLACMEIFTIYAPEVPWDKQELMDIFQQTVRQLGNLAHTTDPSKQPNFRHYARILELFASVKIGCVIVDLAQQDDSGIDNRDADSEIKVDESDTEDDDEIKKITSSKTPNKRKQSRQQSFGISTGTKSTTVTVESRTTPLEIVVDLIHTLLHCVRNEHPVEIMDLIQHAIVACLDEYNPDYGAPIPVSVLDEILLCIGQGPTIWVANIAAHQQISAQQQQRKQQLLLNRKHTSKTTAKAESTVSQHQQLKLPLQVEQTNPTYVIAAAVIRSMLNKLATPIAQLLNGLLNGDAHILEQSCIRCPRSSNSCDVDISSASSPGDPAAGFVSPSNESSVDVYSIVYELHRVAPQILTTVIGTVSNGLQSQDTTKRSAVTNLLGRLFSAAPTATTSSSSSNLNSASVTAASSTSMASNFRACYREWLGRHYDVEYSIRKLVVKYCVAILRHHESTDPVICHEASETLTKCLTTDPNVDVRLEAIHLVTDWVYHQNQTPSQHSSSSPAASLISPALLRAVGSRCSSKHKQERRDAVTGLSKIYAQWFINIQLKAVISGGDDCHVGMLQDVLHRACHIDYGRGNRVAGTRDKLSPKSKKQQRKRSSLHRDRNEEELFSSSSLYKDDEDRYSWIPSKVFECLCYTDQVDPEMRNRVIQIIDEVLLGCTSLDKQKSASSANGTNSATVTKSKMTSSARAIGLAIIFNSIRYSSSLSAGADSHPFYQQSLLHSSVGDKMQSNSFKFMRQFLSFRSKLQQMISSYIDARAVIRECESGTEEAMAAEARAMEILEAAASLSSPVVSGSASAPLLDDILTSLHGARDKHIFRILATIAHPNHTMLARIRALDELPKRTKLLGDAVSDWVHNLVKRCAMSDFLNAEVVHHCVLLAKTFFSANDVSLTALMLSCVKVAVEIFPSIVGSTEETFTALTELFSDCRLTANRDIKNDLDSYGVVTALSSILSVCSSAKPTQHVKAKHNFGADELQTHLMKLCTQDGTPEQARNAVYTLVRLLNQRSVLEEQGVSTASLTTKSSQSSEQDMLHGNLDAFAPLLGALTSSTRLTIKIGKAGSSNIIRTLSALTALSDCAPMVISSSSNGTKALRFALDSVLLGREKPTGDSDDGECSQIGADDEDNSSATSEHDERKSLVTPNSSRKRRSVVASPKSDNPICSPEAASSILENDKLSVHCRRICAAIDFIVTHIRSTLLVKARQNNSKSQDTSVSVICPSDTEIKSVFQLLAQILRDKGLSPSNRDRKYCKARHERAALRQSAGVNLLRLSDARLGLERKYLSPEMWHLLSEVFLDEELVVRETVLHELSSFLTGSGIYGIDGSKTPFKAPSLRFLSLVCLCSDGDHGVDNDMANGSAANVGKTSLLIKNAGLQCIVYLRKIADAHSAQCRAIGKEAEKKFENQYKMMVVPEYSVPFCFFLLSHRFETPSAGGKAVADLNGASQEKAIDGDEETICVTDESQHRVLRKRLKLLFEPLIQSLGDGADNISFLLRMTEILGKHYRPLDTSPHRLPPSLSSKRLSIDSAGSPDSVKASKKECTDESRRFQILEAKLKTICSAAREVLLSFVKKDVNLSSYPGVIQLPSTLFARTDLGSVRILAPVEVPTKSKALTIDSSDDSPLTSSPKIGPKARNSSKIETTSSARNSSSVSTNARNTSIHDEAEVASPSLAKERDKSKRFSKQLVALESLAHDDSNGGGSKDTSSSDLDYPRKSAPSSSAASIRPVDAKVKTLMNVGPEKESRSPAEEEPRSAIKSFDGSLRKTRVHFSPEIEGTGKSNNNILLSDESQNSSSFDVHLSPIPKTTSSPTFLRRSSRTSGKRESDGSSSSLATLETTPPSALRSHTFRSSAADESTDEDTIPRLSTLCQDQSPTGENDIAVRAETADFDGIDKTSFKVSVTGRHSQKSREINRFLVGEKKSGIQVSESALEDAVSVVKKSSGILNPTKASSRKKRKQQDSETTELMDRKLAKVLKPKQILSTDSGSIDNHVDNKVPENLTPTQQNKQLSISPNNTDSGRKRKLQTSTKNGSSRQHLIKVQKTSKASSVPQQIMLNRSKASPVVTRDKMQHPSKLASVPQQITLNRSKESLHASTSRHPPSSLKGRQDKKKIANVDFDDFDFDINEENLPVSKNQASIFENNKKGGVRHPKSEATRLTASNQRTSDTSKKQKNNSKTIVSSRANSKK